MAEVQTAPTKASVKTNVEAPKKKIYGELKKPDLVIYRLVKTNDVGMRDDTPLYPPYIRFPNRDIIVWEFKDEHGNVIEEATREIRWLPGEQSIFVDEQEKNGRKIPDNILNNPNNRFEIIDGDIKVPPHNKTKIYFLDICNRNVDSTHRTGTVGGIFRKYTEEQRISDLKTKQAKQLDAMQKAAGATEEMIYFHAKHLNIDTINKATNGSRDFEAIRTDYVQTAMDAPDKFLKVFDDEILNAKFR